MYTKPLSSAGIICNVSSCLYTYNQQSSFCFHRKGYRCKRKYHVELGHRKMFRRFKALCCCFHRGGSNRSSSLAMQDAAKAFHTVFSDLDFVPTDVVAGLILLKRNQRRRKANCGCPVCAEVYTCTSLCVHNHYTAAAYICFVRPTLWTRRPSVIRVVLTGLSAKLDYSNTRALELEGYSRSRVRTLEPENASTRLSSVNHSRV